jgi:hypothetical protein
MLLNSEELLAFVHLPSAAVATPKLSRLIKRTKAAPKLAQSDTGLILGENWHGGKNIEVRLSPDQRSRHIHCIGASGTGKSTLLFNLIRQDIESGQGIAVLDPHGDLIERILGIIPETRTRDVILLDPSDEEYSIGFNILSAHSDLEKTLLASDLVSVFERLSTSWGDQQRLKAVAEKVGFRATVEKPVLDGQGSIDLVLEKPGHAVACEINVTSTVDYEVGNVTKCLRTGYTRVAVICPRPDRLARLSEAVKGCLAPDEASKVSFYSPEDFITHLQSVIVEEPPSSQTITPTEERRRGYKVRRHYVALCMEDAKAREDAAIKMLAEKMRRTQT